MADKYIKVASLKNKLNYIFRNYGTSKVIRDKVNEAIKSVPCYFKTEFDTTLEVADVQKVKHGEWQEDVLDNIICSACGESFNICDNDTERFIYCPSCGAKCAGEKE